MSEIRRDPLVDRWVIIAPQRARRPVELQRGAGPAATAACPFCPGNESQTPAELLALRPSESEPNGPGWRVRVVPNKYPAVEMPAEAAAQVSSPGPLPGLGSHEVVIESPRHARSLTELSISEVRDVLWVYRERLRALRRDDRLGHAVVFKNVGAEAGATRAHVHSQIVALPLVLPEVAAELRGAQRHHAAHGRCPWCELAESAPERATAVLATSGFDALCPPASRMPYETWVVPRRHESHFDGLWDDELAQLAESLHRALSALEAALGRLCYNLFIHSAPFDSPPNGHYHWHIEIIPRLTSIAGFEWSSGCYINPLAAEAAAAELRALDAASTNPPGQSR